MGEDLLRAGSLQMSKTMNTDANVKDSSEDDTNHTMHTKAMHSDTKINVYKVKI